MESNTKAEIIFDIGSLYDRFEKLADSLKVQGKRYSLAIVFVLMVLAKMSGEDKPSGIAEWAKY